MAPPSNKPTLNTLDPDTLALSLARRALEHVSVMAALLAPAYDPPRPTQRKQAADDALRTTTVYAKVHALARFAISGEALDAPVSDYLVCCEQFYQAVLGTPGELAERVRGLLERMRASDPDTDLSLVIAGALAREQLAEGREPLTSAELAVLSGLSRRQVQQLLSAGELDNDEGRVAPAVARKWLAARGVEGLPAKTGARWRSR